jgi:hypothetical protein
VISPRIPAAAPGPSRGRSRRRSTPTSTSTFRSDRPVRRGLAPEVLLELRQDGERPGFLFAEHAGIAEGRFGRGAARIGVEAQRQRVGDRRAEVDRDAVVEDDVAILGAKLDFLGHVAGARFGDEGDVERLVDVRRDRLAGDHATLLKSGGDAAGGANRGAVARQAGMGLEPLDRGQVEPLGDRAALLVVGDQVDPLAVADPVQRQPMGEILDHPILPSARAASDAASSRAHRVRTAARQ